MQDPVMDVEALRQFLASEFSEIGDDFVPEAVGPMTARMRLKVGPRHLRPGGTVSGPSMFALADVSVYSGLVAMIGPVALAVTTNSSMDFMRKPAAGSDLISHVTMLKIGRVLAVGDALLYSEGSDKPVARATLTYSIPPGEGRQLA